MGLSDAIRRKIYSENAVRLIPGVQQRLENMPAVVPPRSPAAHNRRNFSSTSFQHFSRTFSSRTASRIEQLYKNAGEG